jgi:hypothetical protein
MPALCPIIYSKKYPLEMNLVDLVWYIAHSCGRKCKLPAPHTKVDSKGEEEH